MDDTSLKFRIQSHQITAGAMVFEFFSPGIAKILENAGAEFIVFDMEHTGLGFETLRWVFSTCRGLLVEPMVRVPRGEYTYLARALDLGARGVMVPMVETRDQAIKIINSRRYPPEGQRGAAFGFAQCDYKTSDIFSKIKNYNDRTLIIAQIETKEGLKNVDEIASVPGIDVLWVGHFDLSNFLEIPGDFENSKFEEAMRYISSTAKKHKKVAGFMASDPKWIEKTKFWGYSMIATGPDTAVLERGIGEMVEKIHAKS